MKISFKPIYAFLLVLPLVVWLYNPYELYFLNDDAIYIPKNQHFFSTDHFTTRVLTEFTLQIDAWLYGENAWGYHLTNLLLHFVCTALVYVFVRKCSLYFAFAKPLELAALASYLFLIYAFHSEAVLWIIGRGGSLSTIFAGLSLIFFFDRSKGRIYAFFSLAFFVLGLLTYESIWILPMLVSLLVFFGPRRSVPRTEWIFVMGYWSVFFVFLLCRQLIEGTFSATPYGGKEASLLSDISRSAYNFATLFLRSFLPPSSTAAFMASAGALAVGIVLVLRCLYKRKQFSRLRIFSYVSLLVSLMPYLMFGIDTHDTESERFLYLPSVFVCLIIADLILLVQSNVRRFAVIGLCSLFYLFFLYQAASSFKHSSNVAKTTVDALPDSKSSFNTIYLVDVPTQFKGAYIFRIGFEYILKWQRPGIKYKRLVEVSRREVQNPTHRFSALKISRDSLLLMQPDLKARIGSLNQKTGDRVFLWTDSSFVIVY